MDPTHLSLELLPLDQSPATAPSSNAPLEIEILPMGAPKRDNPAPPEKRDRFVDEATKQYEEGHIDQPLWDRALAQASNDKEAATATYLSARATALRLLHRERRSGRRAPPPSATYQGPIETVTPGSSAPAMIERPSLPGAIGKHRNVMIIAAAIVPIGLGLWLWIGSRESSETKDAAIARSVPVSAQPAAQSPALAAAARNKAVGDSGTRSGATPEFMNKIQELSDAGNWNVLVLYAVEWTRLEPANPAAWNQLRAGYINLRQYDDALSAATKAVELAPADSRLWRNLGQVNMDLNDPAAALVAFDRALAVSPDDATALCLRTSAAQLAVPQKDANATAKQAKSFDIACRGLIEPIARR